MKAGHGTKKWERWSFPNSQVTSYDAATGGNVVNEVKLTYNDFHKVTKSEQAHDGAVTGGTPAVQYAYDLAIQTGNIWTDNARLEKVTYPDGRVIVYTFGTSAGFDDRIDRIRQIRLTSTSGTVLAQYEYQASGRLAEVDYGFSSFQPDVRLNYYNNDSDDEYEGYDRFGRVKYTEWYRYSGTTGAIDRFDYTYDLAGNRLTRDIDTSLVSGAPTDHDQLFTYDELHRLKNFDKGELVSGQISGTPDREEDFTLDALGNWASFNQDANGDGTFELMQDRTHNVANEVTEIDSSSTHVACDTAGNMVKSPKSGWSAHYDLVYDAWNRLVEVKDGVNTVATYEYDGRNYRIEKTAGGVTLDYYYTESWQCVEVHEDGDAANPLEQYVWHPYYIDAAIVRYWDVDTNGSGIAEHYYLHDANFNVTAITDDAEAASVLERYDYTPYGACKVLDANFADDANGVSDVENATTFTGRFLDLATGLYDFRRRDYGAEIGRFCQRDPIGYADGLNLYAGYFVPAGSDPHGTERYCAPGGFCGYDFWNPTTPSHRTTPRQRIAPAPEYCCPRRPWNSSCVNDLRKLSENRTEPGINLGLGASIPCRILMYTYPLEDETR